MIISTEYIAVIVGVLTHFFPEVGSENLTVTIKTLLTLGSALWLLYKRYSRGGINIVGVRTTK